MDNKPKKKTSKAGMWMVYGIIFGAAIGFVVFPDQFYMGIPVGMLLGLMFGSAIDAADKKKEQQQAQEPDKQ